jgi:hypothetical protein
MNMYDNELLQPFIGPGLLQMLHLYMVDAMTQVWLGHQLH